MVVGDPRGGGANRCIGRQRTIDRAPNCARLPWAVGKCQVKGQVHLIGAQEQRHCLGISPGFDHGHPLTVEFVEHDAKQPIDLVHAAGVALVDNRIAIGRIRKRRVLYEGVGHIDPEAIHAAVQPEAQHVRELGHYFRVAPVEVRLGGVEQVVVPLAWRTIGLDHSGP